MLAGNDARADGDFVAISLDVMNAAKCVIVSAAGAGRAEMVAKALAGNFGPFDCPAGLVEAEEETLWFTDKESIAVSDALTCARRGDLEQSRVISCNLVRCLTSSRTSRTRTSSRRSEPARGAVPRRGGGERCGGGEPSSRASAFVARVFHAPRVDGPARFFF